MAIPKFKVGDRVTIGITLEYLTFTSIKGRTGIITRIEDDQNPTCQIIYVVKFDDNDNGRMPGTLTFAAHEIELNLNALQKLKERYANKEN